MQGRRGIGPDEDATEVAATTARSPPSRTSTATSSYGRGLWKEKRPRFGIGAGPRYIGVDQPGGGYGSLPYVRSSSIVPFARLMTSWLGSFALASLTPKSIASCFLSNVPAALVAPRFLTVHVSPLSDTS